MISSKRTSNRPALAALLAALALTACRGNEPPTDKPDTGGVPVVNEEVGGDTLVIATISDAESFISVVSQSASDQEIYKNMFLALTDGDFDCRPVHTPGLAESWEVADDHLSITYHLYKDRIWSDGTPITAADVAFTFDLIADKTVASPRISHIEHMKEDARPRVLDDHTVRFEFTHAYDVQTQMSHTSSSEILPKHILSKYDRASLRGTDFDKNPVVSGPFKLARWDKGSTVVLEPNENYRGPNKAKLKRVIFKVIPEYATRMIELENGSVDLVENIQNVEDIARLKATHPEIKLLRRGWRFMDYVAWNLANPLWKEAEVRRALTMAIDRDKLVKDLLTTADGEVLGKVAVSWITPELCDYRSDEIKPFPYDPVEAARILASNGWKDTDGDGILDKDGKKFSFTLLTNSGNVRRAKATIIIQANLRAIGVDAQLQSIEANTFFERTRKRDYEAALSGWSAALFVDPIELWHSDKPDHQYEFNFTGFSNPKADELMERGMATADAAEAAKIWTELQKLIHDEQPYTYLFWRDEVIPVHERFRDPSVDILSYVHHLERWWVPADKVKYKQ